jgi:hypothetical protein
VPQNDVKGEGEKLGKVCMLSRIVVKVRLQPFNHLSRRGDRPVAVTPGIEEGYPHSPKFFRMALKGRVSCKTRPAVFCCFFPLFEESSKGERETNVKDAST